MKVRLVIALLTVTLVAPALGQKVKKLKTPEFLEKHLASIGAEQSRAKRMNLRARGVGTMAVLVGNERNLQGPAEFTAEGLQFRSSMIFDVSDYPGEEVSFDGKKAFVKLLNPGQRSAIGEFLYRYDEVLTEGLFGGTLNTGWALLHMDTRKPKLRQRGGKKFGENQLYEVQYERRKGRKDVKINLYFLPETMHHVATVYRLFIPSTLPSVSAGSTPDSRASQSSSQVGANIILEEYFGGFRPVDGLALPTTWRVRMTAQGPEQELAAFGVEGASRSLGVIEWQFKYETIQTNVEIPEGNFRLY